MEKEPELDEIYRTVRSASAIFQKRILTPEEEEEEEEEEARKKGIRITPGRK